MTTEEIKQLRLQRQHLLSPSPRAEVLHDLIGIQAQYFKNAIHALSIRSSATTEPLDGKQMLKSWSLRGTMHLLLADDLPLLLHEGRKTFLRPCDTLDGDDVMSADRKRYLAGRILEGVDCGICDRDALKQFCRDGGMTEVETAHAFNPWGGLIRALFENGTLCYRPEAAKTIARCTRFEPMKKEDAEAIRLQRYFRGYGPATVRDAAYFFSMPQQRIKQVLKRLPLRSFESSGVLYFDASDTELAVEADMGCFFLAGFDPLLLGYEKRDSLFFDAENIRNIFSLTGIVYPTIFLNGMIAARWKQNGRRIEILPFRPLGDIGRRTIATACEQTFGKAYSPHFCE